jgi:predicted RNase H-like nuclease
MADGASLGIDWHRRGWVGIILRAASPPVVVADPSLGSLIARVPDAECVGVDMPIGLPAVERKADLLARNYVGRRRNSVFMTPPKPVLDAPSYGAANAIAPGITGGKKISQQAWALRHNIAVVERLAAEDRRVIEVHPEVSFRAMVGHELEYPKSSWNGERLRRRSLASEGIVLPDHLDEGGDTPVADVLDAAAAAWSARRYARHEASVFPEGSHRGQHGVIWY